jgi:hypothetical protein
VSDYDSPWKEALTRFLPAFLAFSFPDLHAAIDWGRGYEVLDKELQQVVREAELGKRLADALFKVWLADGREAWVLIHVEVQSQPDDDFPERMFVYHYRIYDRFRRPVVSLAVLGDDQAGWRPNQFGYSLGGCTLRLEFPVVKLLDYTGREAELEADPNLFAPVVLAHLKTLETREDPGARRAWKVRLLKGLLERGLSAEEIRQLFRLIDWMMDLPEQLAQQVRQELYDYQRERQMPFITSFERFAREEGRQEGEAEGMRKGREEGENEGVRKGLLEGIEGMLDLRFGAAGLELLPALRRVADLAVLRSFQQAIRRGESLDELRRLLPETAPGQPTTNES